MMMRKLTENDSYYSEGYNEETKDDYKMLSEVSGLKVLNSMDLSSH